MQLTHKIELCPVPMQVNYFAQACKKTWNWVLDAWNTQHQEGKKLNASGQEEKVVPLCALF